MQSKHMRSWKYCWSINQCPISWHWHMTTPVYIACWVCATIVNWHTSATGCSCCVHKSEISECARCLDWDWVVGSGCHYLFILAPVSRVAEQVDLHARTADWLRMKKKLFILGLSRHNENWLSWAKQTAGRELNKPGQIKQKRLNQIRTEDPTKL